MDKLKRCPFCGAEAVIEVIPPHTHYWATFMPDYPGSATVECSDCGASIMARTEEEVIKLWNRRTTVAKPLSLEELEACEQQGLPVWVETFDTQPGAWALLYRHGCFGGGFYIIARDTFGFDYQSEDYLNTWRAWTAEPTDEQTEGMKQETQTDD